MSWQDVCDSEHETLLRSLDKMRSAVVRATEGLDEEQLRRPGVRSGTNVLGLVHHLTGRHAGHADILRELIDGRTDD